jgi:hypothetical protein
VVVGLLEKSLNKEGSMSDIKLDAPLDASSVLVMPGIDATKSGIVAVIVDGGGIHIGKYTNLSNYTKELSQNVGNYVDGRPYRENNPDGFRRIHKALGEAVKVSAAISFVLMANWDNQSTGENLKNKLMESIGTL